MQEAAVLAGRYRLGEQLAAGGMGAVYRAVDGTLDRPVAVKVLRRELAEDPTFLERFRREARAAAVVAHPGVASVYDYGEEHDQPFIVMELVEGETLAERLAARGRLDWREAFAVGEQLAAALAAAHAHGLVHRDVKPANVLLAAGGRVKLVDFGIAQADQGTTLTRTGMALGSAGYVAPEQAQGGHVGPAADLYSLGCVLFEAVTGSTPYTALNPVAVASQHVSAPVPDPRERRPDLPAPAAAAITRALAKDPADRYPSAAAMAAALAAAAGRPGAPRTAQVEPTRVLEVPPVGRRGRTRRLLAVAALVVAALLLLAWLPRSGLLHPPAGQQGGPARSTSTPSSAGHAMVAVPDVVGDKLGEAEDRLRDLGFTVEVAGGRDAKDAGRLRVRETSPAPGSLAPKGSVVRLQVGGDGKGKGKGGEGD
ncbi:MAG TPA: protein kinase [Actinomycetes bacterium]|jgi:serine/threonine-protein kinase|nr:protein kinase [Actinomycetes bacterium]